MISPAYASSSVLRSSAMTCCGCESLATRPDCTCFTFMSERNFPEQIRMNAMRSRCALFMLAWILKTNAEKSLLYGSMSPMSDFLASGAGAILRNSCMNISTPKFCSAEPKKTGVSIPAFTSSRSKLSAAPSISSTSPISFSVASSPIAAESALLSLTGMRFSTPSLVPFSVSEYVRTSFSWRSYIPLKFFPDPIGQFTGQVATPRFFSISSNISKVSSASRSILLMNVKIGICLIAQTLKSFLVCGSTPLPPSITITAESAAISVLYVSSEKS